MTPETLLNRVSSILDQSGLRQGALFHEASGTHLMRHESLTSQNATVYRPLLCLILQGAKDVGTSAKTLTVRAGQSVTPYRSSPGLLKQRPRPHTSRLSSPLILVCSARWHPMYCLGQTPGLRIHFRFICAIQMKRSKTLCGAITANAKSTQRAVCWPRSPPEKSTPDC